MEIPRFPVYTPFKGGKTTMDKTNKLTKRIETAQFRFGLIAPAIQGTHRERSDTAFYKKMAEIPIRLPDGSTYQYNFKTYQKWVSLYRSGGIDALMPSGRSDKGGPGTSG